MKLGDWRREKGLTQQDVADAIECVLPTVARYEAGSRVPEQDAMRRIFVFTRGAVRPDDFYDLPDLDRIEAELAASAAAEPCLPGIDREAA